MGKPNQAKDWLHFEPRPDLKGKRKTDVWTVEREDGAGGPLGFIKWHSAWRQYCFFPEPGTLYNGDCLKQIGREVLRLTAKHRLSKTEGGNAKPE